MGLGHRVWDLGFYGFIKFEVFGLRVWGLGLQGSPVGPST